MYQYQAYDVGIQSELELPELAYEHGQTPPDVQVKLGKVDVTGIPEEASKALFFEATPSKFWLNVQGVGRYLVEDGSKITIDANETADEDSIRVFLLGSAMGALLMQRGMFLLHANAIKIGGGCVAFAGRSGIGKSTLTAAFSKRGYLVLADDVCAVDEKSEVMPSFPNIKLWADTSKHLDINTQNLRRIRPQIEKFSVPMKQAYHGKPCPLQAVYILNEHNKPDFVFESLEGLQKIQPLKNNTYRYPYVKHSGRVKQHLKQVAALAAKMDVVRVTRPNQGFQLDELVARIEEDLQQRGFDVV